MREAVSMTAALSRSKAGCDRGEDDEGDREVSPGATRHHRARCRWRTEGVDAAALGRSSESRGGFEAVQAPSVRVVAAGA